MAKTALFGDSYIKRLNRFCDNFLGVPGECRFYGVGGMRADNPHQEVLKSCIDFQPDAVFLCIGGNDISAESSPRQTFEHIVNIANSFEAHGTKTVYIGEIMTRGQFWKSPGLTKETFDKKRKLINRHLRKKYGRLFVTFPDIHFPEHYATDGVHLNTSRTDRLTPGMKKFQCRLSQVLCRH